MERLELRLLGFPELRLNGQTVKLEFRKAAALLIYLAELRRPISREIAAALLWPDADEEMARALSGERSTEFAWPLAATLLQSVERRSA